MIQLKINNQDVVVETGTTILRAAEKLGIAIPTLCRKESFEPSTSCMACVVRVEGSSALIPACGALAQDGMRLHTDTSEVLAARKAAIELLLSEHAGDCEGPCRIGCPAGMDIPRMLRQIGAGQMASAIRTIKADIAIPAILGRICPAPCEKVCRRNQHDAAISICLLKRFAADWDLVSPSPYQPRCEIKTGKKAAIVGAGPCGLAAAYYLTQAGVGCVVFDKMDKPGGNLRSVERDKLPEDILDKEINQILSLENVEFRGGTEVGKTIEFEMLCADFDAVFVATGQADVSKYGLEASDKGIKIVPKTYQTSRKGVFAGGEAAGRRRLAVRAAADGKEAALSILQYLSGKEVTGQTGRFNSRLGQVNDGEMQAFLVGAEKIKRNEPISIPDGFSPEMAKVESRRCLRCDCGKKETCRLRELAEANKAKQQTYKGQRKSFTRQVALSGLVYESGKCILCGLCVQAAKKQNEPNSYTVGLSFTGRGFATEIAVALKKTLDEGLSFDAAKRCADVCPTGALCIQNNGLKDYGERYA